MARYKNHPNDGKNRFDYVLRKIEHMRGMGLIEKKKTGFGFNGGAAPDWLVSQQEEDRKRWAEARS